MKIDRSPDRGSSSSVLFEFLLFDILRRPPSDDDDGSSFLGVTAVLRLISVLDDCEEPFFQHKKFQTEKQLTVEPNGSLPGIRRLHANDGSR